eukprot:Gb_04829 [translate_table: standard]
MHALLRSSFPEEKYRWGCNVIPERNPMSRKHEQSVEECDVDNVLVRGSNLEAVLIHINLYGYGCCVWHGQQWRWHSLHGCDEARTCDEIHCSSCYGWSFGYQWFDYSCDYVIISRGINPKARSYYLFDGYAHLSSGLARGLVGLSAGMAIGIVGDAGVSYAFEL